MEPLIQYAKTSDGVNIAYVTAGQGQPLLWIQSSVASSVQQEWKVPFFRRLYDPLLPYRTLVRFDSRGLGLSDRDVADLSLEAQVRDVEAVVDSLGIERFALLGFTRGGQIAVVYAARHPDHVSHLVLIDAFARGSDFLAMPQVEMLTDLASRNWEMYTENAGGVSIGWEREEARQFSAFIRESVHQETAVALYEELAKADVSELLTSIEAPTLVLRHGAATIISLEMSKELAASIPNATLTVVEGKLADSGDAQTRAVLEFLGEDLPPADEEGREDEQSGSALPQGTAIILFLDIADSTALTTQLGDAAYRERERELDGALRSAITDAGGTPVEGKVLGDGVMAVFTSARQAIECALRCRAEGESAGLPLHLGIHAGDVLR
ncbi:MAG: adenylate/guanylate cyclase domain-containing protein, partial [Chloroflexi bacterium]|nr:adenylate/guanylate cyclase domain-containing protein [Chloroflexota bacterium]